MTDTKPQPKRKLTLEEVERVKADKYIGLMESMTDNRYGIRCAQEGWLSYGVLKKREIC